MQCPKCQSKMAKGFVTVTTNTFNYLMTALTRPFCLFSPADSRHKEARVVEDGKNYKLAYRCEVCNLFVIENTPYNPHYPIPQGFIEIREGENDEGIVI